MLLILHLWAQIPQIDVLIGKSRNPEITGNKITRSIPAYKLYNDFSGKNRFRFFCDKAEAKGIKIELTSSEPIFFGKDPYDGKIFIYSDGRECLVVQSTNIESYLAGVVAKEMHPDWPLEALKAQAVVARSYALSKISENKKSKYHLENSERHQVGGHILEQTDRTKTAVGVTLGEVLVNDDDRVVPAFYHAKCGERSFLPEEIWGDSVTGYVSVPCPYDEEHHKEIWAYRIDVNDFISFLNRLCGDRIKCDQKIKRIDLASDSMKNSKLRIHSDAGIFNLKKSLIRKNYGERKIISNSFRVNLVGNLILIEGKGRGHGVGMGQIGALTMARFGLNYNQILSYYYPNFKVKKVYP